MSILDFKRTALCSDIWDENNFLRNDVNTFVISAFRSFFKNMNIKGYESFTKDIVIGSSLATYYYTDTSDFDVKLIYDEYEFIKYNPTYADKDSISDILIDAGRSNYYLTANVLDTNHAIDAYFYSRSEYEPVNLNKFDSLYSINENRWIQEPKDMDSDFSPDYVLNYAWDKAQNYVSSIVTDMSKAKKSLVDLICLRDYLRSLDEDDIENMKYFFIRKFNEVNDAVEDLIKDRQDLRELRCHGFEKDNLRSDLEKMFGSFNYSDENLIFKVLQRYGYMTILYEIKTMYDKKGVTSDNIDTYLNLVM